MEHENETLEREQHAGDVQGQHDEHDHGHGHRELTVSVNEQPVTLSGHVATGEQIKVAAIAQGVLIQPNFVLQEELPNGTSRIVGDADEVHLRPNLRFTAIAPDDNS